MILGLGKRRASYGKEQHNDADKHPRYHAPKKPFVLDPKALASCDAVHATRLTGRRELVSDIAHYDRGDSWTKLTVCWWLPQEFRHGIRLIASMSNFARKGFLR
jgi:hypothetical protein